MDARQACSDLGTDVCSASLLAVDNVEHVVTTMKAAGVDSGTYRINAKFNSVVGGWVDEDTAMLVTFPAAYLSDGKPYDDPETNGFTAHVKVESERIKGDGSSDGLKNYACQSCVTDLPTRETDRHLLPGEIL